MAGSLTSTKTGVSSGIVLHLNRRALVGGLVLTLLMLIVYFGVSAYIADKFSLPVRLVPKQTPAAYGLPYETVQFKSAVDQIPLTGWYIDSPGDRVVLLMHGRDATMDDASLHLLELMQALVRQGYDVFTFDFRGHGLSGGLRYSFGDQERRDVAGALSYLKSRGVGEVDVIAFSMGAATALNAAPEHPEMRTIVADASFADFGILVWGTLPQATGLPSFFTPGVFAMAQALYGMDFWNNKPANALAHIGNRPVFLIHESDDPQIPVSQHTMLEQAGGKDPNLESWLVQGADHGQAFRQQPEEYMRRVMDFFGRHLK